MTFSALPRKVSLSTSSGRRDADDLADEEGGLAQGTPRSGSPIEAPGVMAVSFVQADERVRPSATRRFTSRMHPLEASWRMQFRIVDRTRRSAQCHGGPTRRAKIARKNQHDLRSSANLRDHAPGCSSSPESRSRRPVIRVSRQAASSWPARADGPGCEGLSHSRDAGTHEEYDWPILPRTGSR